MRFFELDENDEVVWEDFGKFSEGDVHHQYAIALRTPEYKNIDIEAKVNIAELCSCVSIHKCNIYLSQVDVFIQLFRPTDNCASMAVPFQYKPRSTTMTRKRARISSTNNSAEFLPSVLAGANHYSIPTISKEYNTSGLIASCLQDVMPSEELDMFVKFAINHSDGKFNRNSEFIDQIIFAIKLVVCASRNARDLWQRRNRKGLRLCGCSKREFRAHGLQ